MPAKPDAFTSAMKALELKYHNMKIKFMSVAKVGLWSGLMKSAESWALQATPPPNLWRMLYHAFVKYLV